MNECTACHGSGLILIREPLGHSKAPCPWCDAFGRNIRAAKQSKESDR